MSDPTHTYTALQWRPLIEEVVAEIWPGFPPLWIEAQVNAESGGNPTISSPVGARGLLQLMPETAGEVGLVVALPGRDDRAVAVECLKGGVRYLKAQDKALEGLVPVPTDRLFWAFAAYNCGRGYVEKALKLAREDKQPAWYIWDQGSWYLMHRECQVGSHHPDYKQVWGYVQRIRAYERKHKGA
jgi:soluble lytic murein transglycosylase-like protein